MINEEIFGSQRSAEARARALRRGGKMVVATLLRLAIPYHERAWAREGQSTIGSGSKWGSGRPERRRDAVRWPCGVMDLSGGRTFDWGCRGATENKGINRRERKKNKEERRKKQKAADIRERAIKKWILSNQEEPWDCNKLAIVALPLVGGGW